MISSFLLFKTTANSGLIFVRFSMDFFDLFNAILSRILPIEYKAITIKPSKCSPTNVAPTTDMVTKKFSLIEPFNNKLKAL